MPVQSLTTTTTTSHACAMCMTINSYVCGPDTLDYSYCCSLGFFRIVKSGLLVSCHIGENRYRMARRVPSGTHYGIDRIVKVATGARACVLARLVFPPPSLRSTSSMSLATSQRNSHHATHASLLPTFFFGTSLKPPSSFHSFSFFLSFPPPVALRVMLLEVAGSFDHSGRMSYYFSHSSIVVDRVKLAAWRDGKEKNGGPFEPLSCHLRNVVLRAASFPCVDEAWLWCLLFVFTARTPHTYLPQCLHLQSPHVGVVLEAPIDDILNGDEEKFGVGKVWCSSSFHSILLLSIFELPICRVHLHSFAAIITAEMLWKERFARRFVRRIGRLQETTALAKNEEGESEISNQENDQSCGKKMIALTHPRTVQNACAAMISLLLLKIKTVKRNGTRRIQIIRIPI